MVRSRTPGLYSLQCACGKAVASVDVLQRTLTGRETLRHYCHRCGCVSWWWRSGGVNGQVMLFDREEKTPSAREWPPRGWTSRHMPRVRR